MSPARTGWTRATLGLLRELPGLGVTPLLYTDGPLDPELLASLPPEARAVRCAPPMRYLRFEQEWVPRQCERDGVALLHCPINVGLPWRCPVPRVLTLHDAMSWHARPAWWRGGPRLWLDVMRQRIAPRLADAILTVSEFAKADLVAAAGIDPGRIAVAPNAADPTFFEPVDAGRCHDVLERLGTDRPFVLYVGNLQPHKNVEWLIDAFLASGLDDHALVLAGGPAERMAALGGRGDRVHMPGPLVDSDLVALYSEAVCLVHASPRESFGLPLVEAMAAGCPVIASDSSCFPEVLGGAGALFPIGDVATFGASLRRVANDPGWRDDLIVRGRERASAFTWRRSAEETVRVYREVQGGRRSDRTSLRHDPTGRLDQAKRSCVPPNPVD